VPLRVPLKEKVAVLWPPRRVVVATPEQPDPPWRVNAVEGEPLRLTTVSVPTGEGLPKRSRAWTVAGAEQAPAVNVCVVERKTSRSGAAGTTVWLWEWVGIPGGVAVTSTVPALVARRNTVALPAPGPKVTEEMPAPQLPEL
jgi:hypothetical protein